MRKFKFKFFIFLQDFIALGLEKYKVIPYGSAVNGLFTQSKTLL